LRFGKFVSILLGDVSDVGAGDLLTLQHAIAGNLQSCFFVDSLGWLAWSARMVQDRC